MAEISSVEFDSVELGAVLDAFKSAQSAVVVSHYNPDIDAYGSSSALSLALAMRGVSTVCVNESGIIDRYRWFPGVSKIVDKIPADQRQLAFVCDCGDLSRAGDSLRATIGEFKQVINIDHHSSNTLFGTTNFVDVAATSTCEMIYRILSAAGATITPEIATLLLAGIVGDTGSFRYSSTSADCFAIARELVLHGARPSEIAGQLFGESRRASVMLQADALTRTNFLAGGMIAEVIVTAEMYQKHQADTDDSEGLVERARDIEGVRIAVVLRDDSPSETEKLWRISLRSKSEKLDVSAVAQQFGGGGHKQASAFRWRKELVELLPPLRAALTGLLGT